MVKSPDSGSLPRSIVWVGSRIDLGRFIMNHVFSRRKMRPTVCSFTRDCVSAMIKMSSMYIIIHTLFTGCNKYLVGINYTTVKTNKTGLLEF